MTLDQWLSKATRGLSPDSIERVRLEIQQHVDAAIETSADPIASLGDPREANREYRKVLLTATEAYVLSFLEPQPTVLQSTSSRSWYVRIAALLLVIHSTWLFATARQNPSFPYILVILAVFQALPILFSPTTPSGGSLVRWLRWSIFAASVAALWWLALPGQISMTIAIVALLGLEWIKASIRRKLARQQWPARLLV